MQFKSLAPFVPSGKDFKAAQQLFGELGFTVAWDAGDYTRFDADGCSFILQKYDNEEFAQNLMINVNVADLDAFWADVTAKKLAEKYGVKLTAPKRMSYGREVILIDAAGVCWHFVE